MGRRCCVAGCPSTSRLSEHHGVTYHSFPLDLVIRAVWIKNSRVSLDKQLTKSVLVCSRHFRRLDFHTIRNGKYLLKPRVFPTVFPWGKMEASEIEADHRALQQAVVDGSAASGSASSTINEEVIKATVDAIMAQIHAETAERNAAAAAKAEEEAKAKAVEKEAESAANTASTDEAVATGSLILTSPVDDKDNSPISASVPKYGPLTNITIAARLEAQNADGLWLPARIVEINDAEQTVLIRFDRNNKQRQSSILSGSNQQWLSIKSERLRQRISSRVLPVFELDEKCMARWSGPRKFPGTVKKLLGNDTYEVLFDDGYTKNVRALHMSKLPRQLEAIEGVDLVAASSSGLKRAGSAAGSIGGTGTSASKKGKLTPQRKDWPLLDMSNLDLAALGLPDIPHDGEWTCHWVNDQPIGKEGFLIVGEHHKPTVIVEDWRLPPGWIKHMYQRSNVLGKWDVILVSPSGKRFRSKSDLKTFLESQGMVYNPDVYDFSIHRRRAKDINAYVYTHDYSPQQPPKPKQMDVSFEPTPIEQVNTKLSAVTSTPLSSIGARRGAEESQYMETPVASLVPPAELMSPQAQHTADEATPSTDTATENSATASTLAIGVDEHGSAMMQDGYAFIGGLKVQITDNLFVCPREGCGKTYRKEDFLQIHIRHYHKEFAEHVSHCPKMQELAMKRTHPSISEQNDATPKNQIPNQQFFAKLHQQDMLHSRSFRRQAHSSLSPSVGVPGTPPAPGTPKSPQLETLATSGSPSASAVSGLSTTLPTTPTTNTVSTPVTASFPAVSAVTPSPNKMTTPVSTSLSRSAKRSRFSPSKRLTSSRKSSRQRTQRRSAQDSNRSGARLPLTSKGYDRPSFGDSKKRGLAAPSTPISSVDSPATVDSISTPSSNDMVDVNAALAPPQHIPKTPQYIKENGELIRIVSMRQEEIINCICEYVEEDGLMVQCELCLCWQHGGCNGIVKESDVPEKYVCYICRNPQRVRDSMRFKHDQDWLYDGKLPVASFHTPSPQSAKQFELLKRSHMLTGNLLDAKRLMHSLLVKINIAKNRCHPKLYLWAKKWDEDADHAMLPVKRLKAENPNMPHVPQPEAAIDPEECQYRLIEHVKVQQALVMKRINDIEAEMDQLEDEDNLNDLKDADISTTKEAVSTFIRDLETLKRLAKLNKIFNMKKALKEQAAAAAPPVI